MNSLEWDSAEWRVARDKRLMDLVQDANAVRFYLQLSHFVEVIDDLVDQDKPVSPADLAHALFSVLTYMPANPFFNAHRTTLIPQMFTCINAWLDSNDLSSGDTTDKAMAFTLKGAGIDILLSIIAITRGVEFMRSVSKEVRHAFMRNETFADYCKETGDV